MAKAERQTCYKNVLVYTGCTRHVSGGIHISSYVLAEFNVAIMREPLDSPKLAGFASQIDRLNALADTAPGFIWRLQDDGGDATAMRPFGEHLLINMSVWKNVQSLRDYVYGAAHVSLMRRRRQWFEQMQERSFVLWWIPAKHRPTLSEAVERLEALRTQGPTDGAFSFRRAFSPPGIVAS